MKKIYNWILNNKFKTCILVVLLVGIIGQGNGQSELELKKDVIDLEYGERLDDLKSYVKVDDLDDLSYSCDTIDKNDRYPEVGKHVITYKYHGITKELEIDVKDTTAPKLTKLNDVSIVEYDSVNYENYIDVVGNCESQFTKILADAGFIYSPYVKESYYICQYLQNYSVPYEKPTSLLLLNSPFVKKKCYEYMDSGEKNKLESYIKALRSSCIL